MSGQSIMDRVAAAKHSIAGQGLAKSVCKATTEEIIGPKKKHLDYLLQCTNEPNVSIPQLADLLIERTQHSNWVVVYKSLITIHNLINYGNERFTQYLASNNCSFNLGGFVDRGGVQGYDMSTFIRRYAKYLNEKAVSYRQMAFDFCKVKRGKDDGLLRTMNAEKLLKTLPVLQSQLDALLEFDCTPNELTNGVINACFMLLFKDLIRLFACYNDGIINLLEKYFDMNKKQCKDGLDLYKKFLVRMEKVSEFLKVAENVGIDKGDIPDLAKAPASLLEALEQHLASLEGRKGTAVTTATTAAVKPAGFSSALNTMTSNSSAFSISETEKKKILEEESRQLQQLKKDSGLDGPKPSQREMYLDETAGLREGLAAVEQRLKELSTSPAAAPVPAPTAAASSNPFATASPPAATPTSHQAQRPSDDLLGLNNNPFADVQSVVSAAYAAPPPSSNPFGTSFQPQTNGFGGGSTGGGSGFTSEVDFARAFSSSVPSSAGNAAFGAAPVSAFSSAPPGFDAFGDVLQPQNKATPLIGAPGSAKPAETKLLANDLDTSLASLASNLSVKSSAEQVKKTSHQWQPKGESKLTGGVAYQPRPVIQTSTTWTQPQQFPPQMMGAAPMAAPGLGFGQPAMAPAMAPPMMGMGPAMGMGAMRPPMMGMQPAMGMGMQQPMMYGGLGMMPGAQGPRPQPPTQNPPNDPFGAL